MRPVVEADDCEDAVRFYQDVVGGEQEPQVHGDDGERVTVIDVGRATLLGLLLDLRQRRGVRDPD